MSAPVVVVGAGGHAAVIIEVLKAGGHFTPTAIVDPAPHAADVLGVPVVGGDDALPQILRDGVTNAVVALGDNRLRRRIGDELLSMGFALPPIVHPLALVSPSAILGEGVVVMAGAHVGARAVVGALAIVNTGAIVEHDNRIGVAAHVAPGVVLGGGVHVGDQTLIGIGSAARPEVRIGEGVIVGAGSSIVSDIPSGARVGGSPAKPLRPRGSAT